MSIGERIKARRLEIDVPVARIAAACGISPQSVYQWESGDTKTLKGANLVATAEVLRVTPKWLESGLPPKEPGGEQAAVVSPYYPMRDSPLPPADENYVSIPVFDVAASMGLGTAMPDYDTVVDNLRLTKTWVQRHLPGASHASNLAVISAYGDSMQPTFNDGDILLVDRSVRNVRLDAVYVLSFHDELYIKRIQRRPDGSIAIISDNKVYDPILVRPEEKESVNVLGRVLWAWNGKRL